MVNFSSDGSMNYRGFEIEYESGNFFYNLYYDGKFNMNYCSEGIRIYNDESFELYRNI